MSQTFWREQLLQRGYYSVIANNSNWHPIWHQWVHCYQSSSGFTLSQRTTNRLECINSKAKSVCSCYTDLSTFFQSVFFIHLSCLRNECDHTSMMALIKKCASNLALDSAQEQYFKLLTAYASSFIKNQLHDWFSSPWLLSLKITKHKINSYIDLNYVKYRLSEQDYIH